ncbi:unnamed protein product [Ambrosiozyma monospora]|uniref:Unnamed protein product n=1 Tax=Ambrosiozyma monospora TaxID=43982 RepID=A0ACB5T5G6_AMBMO|nr:unnamed protein product [Ambrosiozyma monospora]
MHLMNSKPSIQSDIQIDFPASNNKFFTTQLSQVNGEVSLKFLKETNNVVSIDIGLKGDVRTRLRGSEMDNTGAIYDDDKTRIDVLFNQSLNMFEFDENDVSKPCFNKGYIMETPFEFEFPVNEMSLPSSCEMLGPSKFEVRQDRIASLTVRYEFYVRVKYVGKITKELKVYDVLVPLMFQGDSLNPLRVKPISEDTQLFMNKLKIYTPQDDGRAIKNEFYSRSLGHNLISGSPMSHGSIGHGSVST